MTIPELVMWATVLFVGIPSAWRNPTSAALVMAWFYGVVVCRATGDSTPLEYYPFADVFVLSVIWSKREECNLAPYRNVWHKLQCILLERSRADRVVMVIFAVCWLIYIAGMHDYYTFYLLWALTIVQMFAAGTEALESYRRDAEAADRPGFPGDLLVALRGWADG